jgi:mono/diheme cytochrome c family protein
MGDTFGPNGFSSGSSESNTADMPVPEGSSPEMVALGDRVYHGQVGSATCTGCHGANGTGTPLGPDLTKQKYLWSDGSVAAILKIITEGVPKPRQYRSPMPPMGGAQLSDTQASAAAAYVWGLSHKPASGEKPSQQWLPEQIRVEVGTHWKVNASENEGTKMTTNRVFKSSKLVLAGIVLLLQVGLSPAQTNSPAKAKFVLSSPDTKLAAKVPEIYTANLFGCSGGNQSPPLQWRGAPAGTKSFVLTLFDPDEHGDPSGWWHWIVYDLPATTTNLP